MQPAPSIRYAGFWRRMTAWGIDTTIIQVIQLASMALLGSVANAQGVDPNIQKLVDMGWLQPGAEASSVASLLEANGASAGGSWISGTDILIFMMVSAIYTIWFTAGNWQATPGKRWCKLKVVMADGSPMTLMRSALRHAASGMSWLPFALGYFMIGWAKEKTSMHDAMIGTRVIHRPKA